MKIYAGSYTQQPSPARDSRGRGIYIFDFDLQTGELRLLGTEAVINPSYLCLSRDQRRLYTFEEVGAEAGPMLKAFAVSTDGTQLELINQYPVPGAYPCHLQLSPAETHVLVACYGSGNLLVYPLDEAGGLMPHSSEIRHEGSSGVNPARQEGPHAHMLAFYRAEEVYACDLGLDQVLAYRFDPQAGKLIPRPEAHVTLPPGSGPRHLAFHPAGQHAFVLNELTATVSLLKKVADRFELLRTVDSLPADFRGRPGAAAIRLSPDGRFLYTSERGSNTLAIFRFEPEQDDLRLEDHQAVPGKTPRDFCLTPDGRWLLSAHQDSHSIAVFARDPQDGSLRLQQLNEAAGAPVCLAWA